jgi:hypothetical protein
MELGKSYRKCYETFETRCHLAYPSIWKKKVMGDCALSGGDMQNPYTPKCGQGKTKIDIFRDFLQKPPMSKLWILFQLKFPHCITIFIIFNNHKFSFFSFVNCLLTTLKQNEQITNSCPRQHIQGYISDRSWKICQNCQKQMRNHF